MTARRLRLLGTGLAVVAVIVLTWLLGVTPLLGQAAASEARLVTTTAVNDAQAARLAALAADARQVAALRAQLGTADAALPAKPELAAFFSELGALQQQHGVTVTSYTGSGAVAAAATGAAAPAGSSGAGSAAATPAPAPTASAGPATAAPATTGGLLRVPMQLQVTGGYRHLVDFLGGLQAGPRLFLVDKVAITAGVNGAGYSAAVSGSVYVLPTGTGG